MRRERGQAAGAGSAHPPARWEGAALNSAQGAPLGPGRSLLRAADGLTSPSPTSTQQAVGRMRYEFLQRMLLPCGTPPEREEE